MHCSLSILSIVTLNLLYSPREKQSEQQLTCALHSLMYNLHMHAMWAEVNAIATNGLNYQRRQGCHHCTAILLSMIDTLHWVQSIHPPALNQQEHGDGKCPDGVIYCPIMEWVEPGLGSLPPWHFYPFLQTECNHWLWSSGSLASAEDKKNDICSCWGSGHTTTEFTAMVRSHIIVSHTIDTLHVSYHDIIVTVPSPWQ